MVVTTKNNIVIFDLDLHVGWKWANLNANPYNQSDVSYVNSINLEFMDSILEYGHQFSEMVRTKKACMKSFFHTP